MATETAVAVSHHVAGPLDLAAGCGPAQVAVTLNYYNDPGDGSLPEPVLVKSDTVTNKRSLVPTPVAVTDITGREDQFTLDGNGFQFCHHESNFREGGYRDEGKVEAEYYPEMEQLLKDVTGATRVFIFDHKTRCGPSNWHSLGPGNQAKRGPILRTHVDQSYEGAESLLRWLLPDEADILLKKRWQIINAWRPIKTIYKDPLAVADARTIAEEDLVPAKIIYTDHERESWTIKPSAAHRWYFKYAQRPDEVLLIKCFDSCTDGVARRAPHSAFQDPRHVNDAWRESIEIRTMVFYDT
ncbi:7alpha-cephem-methoxylase P8 chain [Madurella fahalii]|uniref:7alpha-cephem-methoxylase P8 chain n=1 Tax=Madurella fahalii TaxID=1157608 RepID=A0ABQ0GHD5_9PEZI